MTGLSTAGTAPVAFYLDWTFWTGFVALVALVLSQLPPLRSMLRKARLSVEVHTRMNVTHVVGYSNATLYLAITNVGGRPVRVRGVSLAFERDGRSLMTLPGQGFFEKMNDQQALLLVPFTLRPEEHWGHAVQFYETLPQLAERELKQLRLNVQRDVQAKVQIVESTGAPKVTQFADPSNALPLVELFEREFRWNPGSYLMTLKIDTDSLGAVVSRWRFMLYESDASELRSYADDYSTGAGIYYPAHSHTGVAPSVLAA